MTEPLRVLLLDPDGRSVPAGRQAARLSLHRCQDIADLLGRAAAGAADAVLLAPGCAGLDATVVARLRSHGCRVVALVQGQGDHALAARIGIGEQLAAPVDPVALLELLQRAPQTSVGGARRGRGAVVAVWGPPGAPGRTTVTALLAAGALRAQRRVVVVDADLAAGAWALLSVSACPASGLAVALRRAAAGGTTFDDLLVAQCAGIDLLPLLPDPQRWQDANPAAIAPLLDGLAACADVVIVDVGADIRCPHPAYDVGWAHDSAAVGRAVLGGADAVAAVLSADPVGVHRFASWWPVLEAAAPAPVVVANRVGVPRGGRRPQEQVAAVLDSIGTPGRHLEVRWEPKAADGLVDGDWTAARGWRGVPQTLWAGLEAAA